MSARLTIAIRDDSPMLFCGDSPAYRLVNIDLTEEQTAKLVLRQTGNTGENAVREEISRCYLTLGFGSDS